MAKITGKYAYVNGVACVGAWQFSRVASAVRYAASCTGDGTAVTTGNINETGQISGVGLSAPLPTGVDLAFAGVVSNKVGELKSWGGNVRIIQTTYTFPFEAGGPITWVSTFGVQGQLTASTSVGGADATAALSSVNGYTLQLVGGSDPGPYTPVAVDGHRDATLVFRRPEVTYVENGLTYRDSRVMECDLDFNVYRDTTVYSGLEVNDTPYLRISNGSNTFNIHRARIVAHNNFIVDRNGGLVGYGVSAQWTSVVGTTPGYLTTPAGDLVGDSTP